MTRRVRYWFAVLLMGGAAAGWTSPPSAPAGFEDIAGRVEIRCYPDTHSDRLPHLTDGVAEDGAVFLFGRSKNQQGRLRFFFHQPRTVTGFHFYQPRADFSTSRFRISADTDGDGRFRETLAETDASGPTGWSGVTVDPCVAWGIEFYALDGVAPSGRCYPRLTEVRLFGESLADDEQWPLPQPVT
jgi:hypothetical protein